MKVNWDLLLTVTLAVCALGTTGLVVRREFLEPSTAAATSTEPSYVENWKSMLQTGRRLGPVGARVQLIEFADFECGFCAQFHQNYDAVRVRYPKDVALYFVHYPLPMHRFALPAARAAECAAEQARFEPMLDRLFRGQNEFGAKSWREFASEAGVTDRNAFDDCLGRQDTVSRITAGEDLAQKFNIKATPTVIVNGWNIGAPSSEQLERIVLDVIAGRNPV